VEEESRLGTAATSRPLEGTGRDRRCRLPTPPRPGSEVSAHPLFQRLGTPASEHPPARTHWHRQKLVGLCAGAESLPRWLLYIARRTSELFRELAVAHADGSIGRFLVRLSRIDILLLDDFAMAPLKDAERRDFLEICDDRYQRRSLILTSQMPVAHWHEQIGDPSIADSILDRLIHNAYRIELKGESMRKKRRKPGEDEPQ